MSLRLLDLLHEAERKTGLVLTTNLIATQVVPSYNDLSAPLVSEYRAAMDHYHPFVPGDVGSIT